MKEGVVGAEEQVGAVAPAAQVEQKLPGALRHLGSISGLKAASLGQGLWVTRQVALARGPGATPSGRENRLGSSPGRARLGRADPHAHDCLEQPEPRCVCQG